MADLVEPTKSAIALYALAATPGCTQAANIPAPASPPQQLQHTTAAPQATNQTQPCNYRWQQYPVYTPKGHVKTPTSHVKETTPPFQQSSKQTTLTCCVSSKYHTSAVLLVGISVKFAIFTAL